jgi:hypothetical protein
MTRPPKSVKKKPIALAARSDDDRAAALELRDAVVDRVLDDRLQTEVRDARAPHRRIDVVFDAQPVTKPHLLDGQVVLQQRELFGERHLLPPRPLDGAAQELAQRPDHARGIIAVAALHQDGDRRQCVEQEVRTELHLERLELRLRQPRLEHARPRLEPRRDQLARAEPSVHRQREHPARDSGVGEQVERRLAQE